MLIFALCALLLASCCAHVVHAATSPPSAGCQKSPDFPSPHHTDNTTTTTSCQGTTQQQQVNHQLTPGPLLDSKTGVLLQSGWSTTLLRNYNRAHIGSWGFQIKEWDYYYVGNNEYGIAFTVADNSYLGLVSVSFMNFTTATYITQSEILPLTFGSLNMPPTSAEGDIVYDDGKYVFRIMHDKAKNTRELYVEWPDFFTPNTPMMSDHNTTNTNHLPLNGKLIANLTLSAAPRDTMVIVSPFHVGESKSFYYNQKINCMSATGVVTFAAAAGANIDKNNNKKNNNHHIIAITKEDKMLSVLDWGRGVWSYENTWYWSSLSTHLPTGDVIGFNLGYGFSIRAGFSENIVVFNGVAHKLGDVHFYIPTSPDHGAEDFMATWRITDDAGRLVLRFEPIVDRYDNVDVVVIKTNQHQVFGRFYGNITLDDGRVVVLNGETVGFAEKVANRW